MQVYVYILLLIAIGCLAAITVAIFKIRKLQRAIQQTQLQIDMLETITRFLKDMQKENDS